MFVHDKLFQHCLTNTSLVRKLVNYGQKSLIVLATGVCTLKLFTAVNAGIKIIVFFSGLRSEASIR